MTQEKNANNKTTNGAALSTAAEIQKKPQKGKVESIGQEDPWFKQAASKGVKVLPLRLTCCCEREVCSTGVGAA
ncbi:unnamed protein product [Sphagnum troendelagicum]|jgi:PIN domain nuclease of toxin-antitoxin system